MPQIGLIEELMNLFWHRTREYGVRINESRITLDIRNLTTYLNISCNSTLGFFSINFNGKVINGNLIEV